MNSSYKPLSINDFVNPNPVNKNSCNKNAKISLYRDRDYVYYYSYNGENRMVVHAKLIKVENKN